MNAPEFWNKKNIISRFLEPLGFLYHFGGFIKRKTSNPQEVDAKVICVGNLTAGGTGKTPVCIAISEIVDALGRENHFVTRGYGGKLKNITLDLTKHASNQTGDEPLLLAQKATTHIFPQRIDGAKKAVEKNAQVIILDDGFQHYSLKKDYSFIVIDGYVGFANCRIIPAGPLREDIDSGLSRADGIIIIGEDKSDIKSFVKNNYDIDIIQAFIEPKKDYSYLKGQKTIAFAGIGRPEKFFDTLKMIGCDLIKTYKFRDHYPYAPSDIKPILAQARANNAVCVTTAKDAVRLPPFQRKQVETVDIRIRWEDDKKIKEIIKRIVD